MYTPHIISALLIDSDNVSLRYAKPIMQYCSTYTDLQFKNAYGDWNILPHRDSLNKLGIDTVQPTRNGKNATDLKIALDVGKMLTQPIELFFIVSNDGDFTIVCDAIHESGRSVVAIGKTISKRLEMACDHFIDLDAIMRHMGKYYSAPKPIADVRLSVLLYAHEQVEPQNDWVNFSTLGNKLREVDHQFKTRFSGKKLSTWLKDFPNHFEFDGNRVRRR